MKTSGLNTSWALSVALLLVFSTVTEAQQCPLTSGTTAGFPVRSRAGGPVLFSSKLDINPDGAPNAYHRVLGPTLRDPGLLHICNGVSVLERRNGRMVNRYPQIGGADIEASRRASASCKADVFVLQEQGFPDCSTGTCLKIFGFDASLRACGAGSTDMSCGIPIGALGPGGKPTGFWISVLSWFDASKNRNDPSRYPDPRFIPQIVLPGGAGGAFARTHGVKLGDLALVVWHGRGVFAAFSDAGPANKLGEGSPALLNRLRGVADSASNIGAAISANDPATTLLLPGSGSLHGGKLPADAAALAGLGVQALTAAGGLEAYRGCPGLGGNLDVQKQ